MTTKLQNPLDSIFPAARSYMAAVLKAFSEMPLKNLAAEDGRNHAQILSDTIRNYAEARGREPNIARNDFVAEMLIAAQSQAESEKN